MNRIFQSYYDIVTEQGEQNQNKQKNISSLLQNPKPKNADLIFSTELATELSHTVNEFTSICAQIVEKRVASEKTKDKFDELYGKIKSLVDAAGKTAQLNKIS